MGGSAPGGGGTDADPARVVDHGSSPRSWLYVPADRREMLDKAPGRGADALILDLEDAVAPDAKASARAALREWLAVRPAAERAGTSPALWVRVTADGLDRDLAAAVCPALRGVVVPKAEPALLARVDEELAGREADVGLSPGTLDVAALVESASGLRRLDAIAAAPRVTRLALGEADLRGELGLRPGPDDAELTPLRLEIVVASAAAGLERPFGPTSTQIGDADALRASTEALLRLGFRGRTAIHPAQVPVINEVFTPDDDEVAEARKVVARFEESGGGAVADDEGRMLDAAVVRSARDVLARAAAADRRG